MLRLRTHTPETKDLETLDSPTLPQSGTSKDMVLLRAAVLEGRSAEGVVQQDKDGTNTTPPTHNKIFQNLILITQSLLEKAAEMPK